MDPLHLIVGLGNPGREYTATRHNAGFLVVEELAERWRAEWKSEKKFQARLAKVEREGRRAVLCQPQTFMNASGDAVGSLVRFHRLPLDRLLVVVDDADLPLGGIRLRARGSSGGHHGLDSIEQHLGTRDFPRLRVGIGRIDGVREITGHVLGRFSPAEKATVEKVMALACEQVECWWRDGIQKAMNQFNRAINAPVDEGKK